MLLKSITISGLLSFGPEPVTLEFEPLTVLIGPNGSGKSNLLDVIGVLQAAPKDLWAPIRSSGGILEWLWKGSEKGTDALISVRIYEPYPIIANRLNLIQHKIRFSGFPERSVIEEHIITGLLHDDTLVERNIEYDRDIHRPGALIKSAEENCLTIIPRDNQSILSDIKDYYHYPHITTLGEIFSAIKIYRDLTFSRVSGRRLPQAADARNDALDEGGTNLGLILSQIRRDPEAKRRLLEYLRLLYDGIHDFDVIVEAGTVQVFLEEENRSIPATRLSDGTLRYLSLLAILCHPNPPPLVCIEEPELGLHPDILPSLARLLQEASSRMQLIVTTHSDILVDALSDTPECIVVCEKHDGATRMTRLNADDLKEWLEHYTLGQLWQKGQIGGTRW